MFFRLIQSERARHATIAIVLALFASAIALMKPLDIAIWALQSKIVEREASGDIVLVEMDRVRDDDTGQFNRSLSDAIERLLAQDVGRIFVNLPLNRSSSAASDQRLRALLRSNPDRITVAHPGVSDERPTAAAGGSDPFFTDRLKTLDSSYELDFLGYVWEFPRYGDDRRKTLSFGLASRDTRLDKVAIDTSIEAKSIPRLSREELSTELATMDAENRTFVIGTKFLSDEVRIGKNGYDTTSVAHILAAETLDRGGGLIISGWILVLLNGVALLAALRFARRRRHRRAFYFAWTFAFCAAIVLFAIFGLRGYFADTTLIFAIYGGMRGIANYRTRHMFVDPVTKAPNFLALRRDLEADSSHATAGIVAVKILRLDAIFAGLSLREKRLYLQHIAKRLGLTDQTAKIYFDDGKYFAFLTKNVGTTENQAHLAGLRAIASQPVSVEGRSLDVAITIGADFSFEASIEHRLSSAISAADQAREAFRPVFIISSSANPGDDWDHSLTARLAEALAQDRIKIKLQPQVALGNGEIVGAEALARWQDTDGREIPPSSFISQCEQMGRLDDLTKRIMDRSMDTSRLLQNRGHDLSISVNVSAVQFVDDRIARIVEDGIERHGIDPSRLKLEITETARIEDFRIAEQIMDRLRNRNIRFSLDDFGVGSANLEVLHRLPFEEVKIDRMFVKDLARSKMARSIAEGVLGICEGIGVNSVAEGIEDVETYRLLRELGCKVGQGYFIAKPQWISHFVATLDIPKGKMFQHSYG
ncbi:EAL domain-containing protein [Qipengyuania sp. MTN3-11]|uniref:EAL domain-containing protein n=1 Tax=Qipengyuania sp. MTN3-11 TaxID=3056557 RepID=UPI0036F2F7F3